MRREIAPGVTVSVGLVDARQWPDGTPTKSENLPDGRTQHTFSDGVKMIVPAGPSHVIEYLSTWVGAKAGETYEVNASLTGRTIREGFFEVWNFDRGKLLNYRFDKTVRVRELSTGEVFTGPNFALPLRMHCPLASD